MENKKYKAFQWLSLLTIILGLATPMAVFADDASALAKKHNCFTCHSVDKKVVGPAYKNVAAKYKGDPSAIEKLALKVKNGGKGVWGSIPMPPNKKVPDEDIKKILGWILSLQ